MDLLKEATCDFYYSLISPQIIIPIIFVPLFLFIAIDIWGTGVFANTFDSIKMLNPFTTTEVIMPAQNFECIINGEKYKVSKDACNDIRERANVDQEANVKTPTPTTKIQNKINYPTSTPDPDPIVTCLIHADCGGGSRQLKQSVCRQTTCCQIGSSWIFYESSSKCDRDQNSYNNQNKYVVPTYAPLPTWAPLPTLKPFPTFEPYVFNPEDYDEPTVDPEYCKRQILNSGYSDGAINTYCNSLIQVESSALYQCIEVKKGERDRLISNCGG